jgi:hypothetical protein
MARNRMRRAVRFDTTPLIWGVRKEADPEQYYMRKITHLYIKT